MQRLPDKDQKPRHDWLERAMAAHQAGQLADADGLYRRAIEAEPRDGQALRLRGILARERGDAPASARYLVRAAEVAPGDPAPWSELAVTRMTLGDLEGAEAALRTALRLDPGHGRSLANLGALLQYRGHVIEAIALHERALAHDPTDCEVRCNLAKALVDAGRGSEALACCEEGLAATSGHPLLLAMKGAVLNDLGDFAAAVAAFEQAVLRYPDDDMAWVNLAYARTRRGETARAIEALGAARRVNPDGARATADLVNLLSGTGRSTEALALADEYLAAHPGERHVLAALGYALGDAGREEEAQALVDLGRFIRVFEPEPPAGYASIAEFNGALRELIETDPSLLAGPPSKATRGGYQTGELDLARHPVLAAFRTLIDAAVHEAAATFSGEGLDEHPLMACAAPRWSLRAWGTMLETGGRQAPHIHPLGWLSAAYYAHVPADMGAAGAQAGWIEFGRPPERFLVNHPPPVRALEPRAGRLVLFPSYFYHRTLPFSSRERRMSIAFDVVPRPDLSARL